LPAPLSLRDRGVRDRDAAVAPARSAAPRRLPCRRGGRRRARGMNASKRIFLAEVREQPAALLTLLEHLDDFVTVGRACAERKPTAVRLVGHGSSDARSEERRVGKECGCRWARE